MLGLTAEQIGTVLLAISLLITGKLAQQKGKDIVSKSPPQEGTMEIAGAVISDRAVDRLVKSLDAFSAAATLMTHAINTDVDAKTSLTKALIEHGKSMDRNTGASEDVRNEIREAGAKLERLKDELIRAQSMTPGGRR